ncbi:molybdopterin converting factor, small subunit [Beggiatoa alba B18LD]|uniref:Molybdopterin synthase sulfur carrier subunit n=1 Tax=Beggiatoa alba B18LD TaxID=395493 RepID=I3CHA7_9GAMM|nr:MoaD/ThiS family protein [Beggiatoa alba]EIJ43000.1 molybdopterin converting factor, small subunit [Beggiatoa alba B18LD]
MMITIKFFASLRQLVGKKEMQLTLTQPISVREVWTQVCAQPLPDHALMAINLEYVNAETLVQAGDEIAFFPPVTGG